MLQKDFFRPFHVIVWIKPFSDKLFWDLAMVYMSGGHDFVSCPYLFISMCIYFLIIYLEWWYIIFGGHLLIDLTNLFVFNVDFGPAHMWSLTV